MASLKMGADIFPFDADTIKKVRARPGNYAFGRLGQNGELVPKYIGRADSNLRDRLSDHIGKSKYHYFKLGYAESAQATFYKECENFHDFKKQLDNDIHPDRPDGTSWECPRCDCFDD